MYILLACNNGASTSIVVQKMKEAAAAKGIDCTIRAVDMNSVQDEIGKFDVLLIGPQIMMHLNRFKKMVNGAAPVDAIKPLDYGRLRGENILNQALQLIEKGGDKS